MVKFVRNGVSTNGSDLAIVVADHQNRKQIYTVFEVLGITRVAAKRPLPI